MALKVLCDVRFNFYLSWHLAIRSYNCNSMPFDLLVFAFFSICVQSETQKRYKKNAFNTYQTFSFYETILVIWFSYNVLFLWNCMKLYDESFFHSMNLYDKGKQKKISKLFWTCFEFRRKQDYDTALWVSALFFTAL